MINNLQYSKRILYSIIAIEPYFSFKCVWGGQLITVTADYSPLVRKGVPTVKEYTTKTIIDRIIWFSDKQSCNDEKQ